MNLLSSSPVLSLLGPPDSLSGRSLVGVAEVNEFCTDMYKYPLIVVWGGGWLSIKRRNCLEMCR